MATALTAAVITAMTWITGTGGVAEALEEAHVGAGAPHKSVLQPEAAVNAPSLPPIRMLLMHESAVRLLYMVKPL